MADYVITNPVTGERVEPLVTAEESGGEYVRARITVAPRGEGPPEHVHQSYDETFEVEEGTVTFYVDGEPRSVGEGEDIQVERGTPHTFANETDSELSFVAEARPASRLGELIRTLCGLAHEGELRDDGSPRFLQAMVIGREFQDDTYFTSPPLVVQKALWTVFAPVGRALGYEATYDRFDDEFWRDTA